MLCLEIKKIHPDFHEQNDLAQNRGTLSLSPSPLPPSLFKFIACYIVLPTTDYPIRVLESTMHSTILCSSSMQCINFPNI